MPLIKSAEISSTPIEIRGPMKKLLIFDLNQVLIDRIPMTLNFIFRPYVLEFLHKMEEHYTLAVWTSTSKSYGKRIVKQLFLENGISLLFQWFQNRCSIKTKQSNSFNCNNEQLEEGEIQEIGVEENSMSIKQKPEFLKNLSDVWSTYSDYNTDNTVSLLIESH
jgi:hypothetical protein